MKALANKIFPDWIKKLFTIPFFYQAEVTHATRIITESGPFDVSKFKASSVSFVVPENTVTAINDTVKIMSLPLAPGDPMIVFKSGIPNIDRTKYDIQFQKVPGTQPVLYAYITSVGKFVARQPIEVQPCKEEDYK